MPITPPQRTLVLFNHDWDAIAHQRLARTQGLAFDEDGFDLFSFPSNARLAWFDMERFVERLARKAQRMGWTGVTSNQEQFGALAAALLAERMGWPGTPVKAILACQHKLYARQVLERVAPEANVRFQLLEAEYGAPVPEGLTYPLFVKPVKAAFSVLAKRVETHEELHRHTRFGRWELWVIRRLVEPFERMAHERLGPGVPIAHRMLLEEPVQADQFNLDGYVFGGEIHAVGVVDAIMYPGTQAFMRHEAPSRLPAAVQAPCTGCGAAFSAGGGLHPWPVQHGILLRRRQRTAHGDRVQPAHGFAVFRSVPARAGDRHACDGAGAGAWARPGQRAASGPHGRQSRQFCVPGVRPRGAGRAAHASTEPGDAVGVSRWAAVSVSKIGWFNRA
jgi:hypothetical protein